MISHIVMFNLREDLSEEERKALLNELPEALGTLPTVQNFRMGIAIKPAWKTGTPSYEFMFSMEFRDEQALWQYMEDHRQYSRTRLKPAMKPEFLSLDVMLGTDNLIERKENIYGKGY